MMRPAFATVQQAAAFALLLAVLLCLPVVVGQGRLPTGEQEGASQNWYFGGTHWIFQEQGDIDIAFLGSSHIYNAIDTPYVQAKLSEAIGRPAVVRTISWPGGGHDSLYFMARELLARRKVRLLVFYDETIFKGGRNRLTTVYFRWNQDKRLLAGLPLSERGMFYFAAILGMPHNLLDLLRPNLTEWVFPGTTGENGTAADARNQAELMQDLPSRPLTFGPPYAFDSTVTGEPCRAYTPVTTARPGDAVVYGPATETNFSFTAGPVADWETNFVRHFAALLREHDVQPVMLYVPRLPEVRLTTIPERAFWPEYFDGDLTMLGIPPARMFGGLTDSDIAKLYGETEHLNQNGQLYFTRLITPELVRIYEASTNH